MPIYEYRCARCGHRSGWYATDFKNSGTKKPAAKADEAPKADSATKGSETKSPETKSSETKAEPAAKSDGSAKPATP